MQYMAPVRNTALVQEAEYIRQEARQQFRANQHNQDSQAVARLVGAPPAAFAPGVPLHVVTSSGLQLIMHLRHVLHAS